LNIYASASAQTYIDSLSGTPAAQPSGPLFGGDTDIQASALLFFPDDGAGSALRLSAGAPDNFGFNLPEYYPGPSISPGTGRLYIWKETLKLIAKKPLTGYGLDTLSYAFPQNHLDKIAGLGAYSIYVTKPHNAFIAYAYGAGIPALAVFLLFNAFAAVAFMRWFLARRKAGEAPDIMIMCAHLGWAAYLVQAFVNDDLISTTPLWWTLFGIGAGMVYTALRSSGNKPEAG
jgi:hypothetical protein